MLIHDYYLSFLSIHPSIEYLILSTTICILACLLEIHVFILYVCMHVCMLYDTIVDPCHTIYYLYVGYLSKKLLTTYSYIVYEELYTVEIVNRSYNTDI